MMHKTFFAVSIFIVAHLALAQERDDFPQRSNADTQSPAPASIQGFLNGLAGAVNGAIKQVNQAAANAKVKNTASVDAQTGADTRDNAVAGNNRDAQSSIRPDASLTLASTNLAGIFISHPYDGTPASYFPRVAITVVDWSRNDCWKSTATIWWSAKRSEVVEPFNVCWRNTLGSAMNGAVNYQLFMTQAAEAASGNVRTAGPKPPMMSYPRPDPFGIANYAKGQEAKAFIQQIVAETGWQPGAPTNIWIVRYEGSAKSVAGISAHSTTAP